MLNPPNKIGCCYSFSEGIRMEVSELFEACENGEIEQVKLLIDAGANVNVFDQCNITPLHEACFKGNIECTKLLIF